MPSSFLFNLTRFLGGMGAYDVIPGLETLHKMQKSNEFLEQLSPIEQERLLKSYHDSIGLSIDADFGDTAFKDHKANRVKDYTGFKAQIGATEEDTLSKALKVGDADPKKAQKEAVQDQLKDVFKLDPRYENAQKRYEDSIAAFKDLTKKVPDPYSVEDIKGVLEEVQQKGRKAIEFQQKLEKDNLKQTLDTLTKVNPPPKSALADALNVDEDKANKIKESLIEDLKKTHAAQLKAFEDKCAENMELLHQSSANEMRRIIFMAQLEKFNAQLSVEQRRAMEDQIEEIRAKNRGINPDLANSSVEVDCDQETFTTINPKDLKFIASLTGNTIKHNDDGTWSVEMTRRIKSPGYYLSNKQSVETDLLTMAQAVRASGFETITMKVSFGDAETQKERSRQSYVACLDAGFDPENIKLKNGNGEEIKLDTLFSEAELKQLHENAKGTRDELDALKTKIPKKVSSKEHMDQMKQEIFDGRKAKNSALDKAAEEREEQEIDTQLRT